MSYHFTRFRSNRSPNIHRLTSPSAYPPACCALVTPTPTHAHGQCFEQPWTYVNMDTLWPVTITCQSSPIQSIASVKVHTSIYWWAVPTVTPSPPHNTKKKKCCGKRPIHLIFRWESCVSVQVHYNWSLQSYKTYGVGSTFMLCLLQTTLGFLLVCHRPLSD